MAIKSLQIELLENNLIIDLDAEETMLFSTLLSKLKTEDYIKTDITYFIKTVTGMPVKDESSVGSYKQSSFVITQNSNWKSPASRSGNLADIPETLSELILNDNKYWVLPSYSGVAWDNDDLQTQLFCLNGIGVANGKEMSVNLIVQYSINDTILSGSKHISERTMKIKQILGDALNIELVVNNITENNIFNNVVKLSEKMHYYLTSYMELKWATKIHGVSIVGFREYES